MVSSTGPECNKISFFFFFFFLPAQSVMVKIFRTEKCLYKESLLYTYILAVALSIAIGRAPDS